MTQQRKALAATLQRIHKSAQGDLIRSADMTRNDRERAQAAGWLHPIIKGWYLTSTEAAAQRGGTVLWFSHFWPFVRRYLNERFADGYCLNAEASLDLHTGATTVPRRLIVITREGGAHTVELPHGTYMQSYPDPANLPQQVASHEGIRIMTLVHALCRVTPQYFQSNRINAEIALNMARDSDLSRALITGRNTRAASRLMGAYRFLGKEQRARRIKQDMQAGGSRISPVNPFHAGPALLRNLPRIQSPHVGRLRAMWAQMRPLIIEQFPAAGNSISIKEYLAKLEDIHQHDAYNSLSIEGYRVTPELIEKVRTGNWDLQQEADREHVAAMAAKGYFDTFQHVKDAVRKVLEGASPAKTAEQGLQDWYRALFGPSVQAGILETGDLAGFRNHPVYILGSHHVPPPSAALMDCMETFFALLTAEPSAAARAVLGHFMFVFIHPYADGNGRLARLLMNLMLASGNYPWTIIRRKNRGQYMAALEQASVQGNIAPFAQFIAREMQVDWTRDN